MIAIDTNVLIRYYIDDDHAQHLKAKRFIDENEVFVNNIVLLESFCVLTRVYEVSRGQVSKIFDHLKRLSNVRFEDATVFSRALMEYRDHQCDFADALLGLVNLNHGLETASFDRKAQKRLGFRSLDFV